MPIIDLKKIRKAAAGNVLNILGVIIVMVMLVMVGIFYGRDTERVIGVVLLFFSLVVLSLLYFKIFYNKIFGEPKQVVLIETIAFFTVVLAILIYTAENLSSYLIPVPAAAILLTILLSPEVALISLLFTSILSSMIVGFSLSTCFVFLAGGLAAIYSSRYVRNRRDLNRTWAYILAANIISITTVGLITGTHATHLGVNIGWGAANSLISVMIASGLLPIFESLFAITTNIRLLELGDFNQPLLKRLMLEAPGTYHHSLMVGNLAENACARIGANPLLARVGAYYHDIGKLVNPEYFIENQMHSRDKHKNLKPNISALILKRHVKEGLALAEEHKLDRIIKDMIAEHQGTTLIEYFYRKVIEETKEEETVDKKEYRYPGPRPRTREAGVLMLADAVEAACRTLEEPTYSRISGLVTKVINNKFIDNQLNNCDLTLANLEEIQKSFIKTLSGIYHSRIEYPEDKEENSVG
ncbi:MAG: HDIG domain-containing protein [Elusimicrobia bacterium]|nr:HDIG domain-containing protein [Elusimicrobiota bacterium]